MNELDEKIKDVQRERETLKEIVESDFIQQTINQAFKDIFEVKL